MTTGLISDSLLLMFLLFMALFILFFSNVYRWFAGPQVTLQDCLSAFFSADELKGLFNYQPPWLHYYIEFHEITREILEPNNYSELIHFYSHLGDNMYSCEKCKK